MINRVPVFGYFGHKCVVLENNAPTMKELEILEGGGVDKDPGNRRGVGVGNLVSRYSSIQ